MPTLLELQHDMRAGLVEREVGPIAKSLANGLGPERLDIYRNTILTGLKRALRLAFPAVERLVGGEFFAGAAEAFIADHPPRAAYLDQYGVEFPVFLSRFPSAASVSYLADVARLEWAVSCALHAPDEAPLELRRLAALASEDQCRVSFRAHPSVGLMRSDFPVETSGGPCSRAMSRRWPLSIFRPDQCSCWSNAAKPVSKLPACKNRHGDFLEHFAAASPCFTRSTQRQGSMP
jgi:Putative DNA-binding domain